MKKSLKTLVTAIASLVLAVSAVGITSAAHATVDWVSAPTWGNLHSKIEDGVFEQARREFDTGQRLVVESETQHATTYIRTDRNNVTVQYKGGAANAHKRVQFVLSGEEGVDFTDNVADPDNIVETDGDGNAEVTLTLTNAPRTEDILRAAVSSGEGDAAVVAGPMVLMWQAAGFYPVIKLIGSGQGFSSQCLYRYSVPDTNPSVLNHGQVTRAHECTNGDFQEYTWLWSVFKKSWLPDYSQVYVKSYKYGSTITLNYKVTDIWGTPIADKRISLNVDSGRICRWKSYVSDRNTDANGLVTFTMGNNNTLTDVKNNRFVNSDTHASEGGFIALSIQPTANELDESADFMWPQIVTDVTIKATGSALTVLSRGGQSVNSVGDFVTNINGSQVTNPPLTLDTTDSAITDINVVNLNITYSKNSLIKALYSPDIVVTADNGGKAAIFEQALHPLSGFASSASFSSPLKFSYTFPQRIALMCTKTGVTTFKIYTGTTYKTHTMSCANRTSDAHDIVANPVLPAVPAVPGTPVNATFTVKDRWGSPVQGVTVRFSATGAGQVDTVGDQVTDANGVVTAALSSQAAGDQVVTATVQDPNSVTQISSGVGEVSTTVHWGVPTVTVTIVGRVITFTYYNLATLRATILDNNVRSYLQIATGTQTATKRVAAGRHVIKVTVGSVIKTVTLTAR